MKILRVFSPLVVAGLLFLCSSHTAKADPHALFYTAVGQQQLFFNVLAALDQADYVEPADGAQDVSRAELLQDRSGTAFGPPTKDDRLAATRTRLSSVLTRNITLEGYDLWTAYQLQNRANDFQTTVAISELARLFCQEAIGIPLCDAKTATDYVKRAKGIITDPVSHAILPIESGALAVLLSGSPQDQTIRRQIVKQFQDDPFAWEYNPSIAAAWAAVSGDNNTAKKALLGSMLSDTLAAFVPTQVDPGVYERIASINEDGTPNYSYDLAAALPPGTVLAQDSQALEGLDFTAQYVADIYGSARNEAAALEIAQGAENNARADQSSDNEGFKATKYSTASVKAAGKDKPGGTNAYERIGTKVLSPAESRVASTHALKQASAVAESSRTSAPVEGQFSPGEQELLLPFDADGSVQGIQSAAQTQPTGQVAGFIDELIGGLIGPLGKLGQDIIKNYLKDQKSDIPIQGKRANLVPIYREQGLQDALTIFDPAFSGDSESGFSSDTQGVWSSYCDASSLCF